MAIFPDAWLSELLSKSDLAAIASEYTCLSQMANGFGAAALSTAKMTPSFSRGARTSSSTTALVVTQAGVWCSSLWMRKSLPMWRQ